MVFEDGTSAVAAQEQMNELEQEKARYRNERNQPTDYDTTAEIVKNLSFNTR